MTRILSLHPNAAVDMELVQRVPGRLCCWGSGTREFRCPCLLMPSHRPVLVLARFVEFHPMNSACPSCLVVRPQAPTIETAPVWLLLAYQFFLMTQPWVGPLLLAFSAILHRHIRGR